MSEPADEVDVLMVIVLVIIALLAVVLGNGTVGDNEDGL